MNWFDFIIYQQTTYPELCMLTLFSIISLFMICGLALIIHGFPTQKMVYVKHEAQKIPSYQRIVTGSIKEEAGENKAIRKRVNNSIKNAFNFIVNHPKEMVSLILLFWGIGIFLNTINMLVEVLL